MKRLNKSGDREACWRERLERQADSGRSIAAFCKEEGISPAAFYGWRARLAKAMERAGKPTRDAPFLDLGMLAAPPGAHGVGAGFDLRIELPGGVWLTIGRR